MLLGVPYRRQLPQFGAVLSGGPEQRCKQTIDLALGAERLGMAWRTGGGLDLAQPLLRAQAVDYTPHCRHKSLHHLDGGCKGVRVCQH